jgi:hypothetical protein
MSGENLAISPIEQIIPIVAKISPAISGLFRIELVKLVVCEFLESSNSPFKTDSYPR